MRAHSSLIATGVIHVKPIDGPKLEAIMVLLEKRRARQPSRNIDYELAVHIALRLQKGEYQHWIAADIGVNQGRISEIKTGKRFIEVWSDPRLA